MKFQGALIKEQGQTFAICVVNQHVLQSSLEISNARDSFAYCFPGVPIILMAQNNRGVPTYQGRTDIVKFLTRVSISAIPWKEYTFS